MKKLFLFLTVAALLSGCDHSDEQSPIVETGRIDLRPGIEALTRSPHLDADGSGTFADGDVFSLTISVNGTYTEGLYDALYYTQLGRSQVTRCYKRSLFCGLLSQA